jgi:hypothetical protein
VAFSEVYSKTIEFKEGNDSLSLSLSLPLSLSLSPSLSLSVVCLLKCHAFATGKSSLLSTTMCQENRRQSPLRAGACCCPGSSFWRANRDLESCVISSPHRHRSFASKGL